jgi:hypothetical protein
MAKSSSFLPFCTAAVLAALSASAWADARIGSVVQQQFNGATGQRGSAGAEQLVFDREVFAEETVSTPPAGSTVLRFADRTQLQVGQSSSVVLDRFVYDPQTQMGDESISFSKGLFRFISGDVKNEQSVGLRTPTATIALRGTKLKIYVAEDGSTTVGIIEGSIDVTPCGGGPTAHGTAGQAIQVTAACNGATQVSQASMPGDPAVDSDYAAAETGGPNSPTSVARDNDGPQGNGESRPGLTDKGSSGGVFGGGGNDGGNGGGNGGGYGQGG